MGHFHARVRIPLSAGTVELTVDVPDLEQLTHQDTALVFGVLNKAIDFARDVTLAEVEEEHALEPAVPEPEDEDQEEPDEPVPTLTHDQVEVAPAGAETVRPVPSFPLAPEEVPCPDCERSFTRQGLAVHRARAHARRAPSAPEPRPEPEPIRSGKPDGLVPAPRVCAEPGCDTLLSAYNKRKWCSIHEGRHLSPHFGRTG